MSMKSEAKPAPGKMGVLAALSAQVQGHKRSEDDRRTTGRIKVCLFCGGRGSASLIRELTRWPQIHLTLMVNGYDDGLSTGELRDLVPNMLGPSDFRKNLSRLVDLHSDEQYALQRLIEYRFSKTFSEVDIRAFEEYVDNLGDHKTWLPSPLDVLFGELQAGVRRAALKRIKILLQYKREHNQPLNYSDCSLGNLVFAGAYLESDDFNASVRSLAAEFGSFSELVNVTCGENRTLVALKADGQLLVRESEIVGPQSPSAIEKIFLIEKPLDQQDKTALESMTFDGKLAYLGQRDCQVNISPEADLALRRADIIVYGPGTQFSSLLPSYRTVGLPEAIQGSKAAAKIFVSNLDEDYDIQGLSVADLVDNALNLMGDPENSKGLITHILRDSSFESRKGGIVPGAAGGHTYKSAALVEGSFESVTKPGTHNGYTVVRQVIDLYDAALRQTNGLCSLEIYVDLRNRTNALNPLLQDFADLPWTEQFDRIQLHVNKLPETDIKLPAYATLTSSDYRGSFTEVDALLNWLAHSDSEYLVTLTGDGEYRLADIFIGVQVLRIGIFGALYGSRTQSRHQFRSALDSAYGEHLLLRWISWCGAFLFTAIFGLLFRVIFSDPFTGFRIYRRSRFDEQFMEELRKRDSLPPSTVTRLMIKNGIEIAEIPVTYRTFKGFTRPGWRILRGLKNLGGLIC